MLQFFSLDILKTNIISTKIILKAIYLYLNEKSRIIAQIDCQRNKVFIGYYK